MAELSSTTGLQPIVPPTAPPSEMPLGDVGAVWMIGSGLLLVFAGLVLKRCTQRWRARHRMQRIRQNLRDNKNDQATTAYQTAELLRWHFSFNRLESDNPPAGVPAQPWQELIRQLETLRYSSRRTTDSVEFEPMFATLKQWFRC